MNIQQTQLFYKDFSSYSSLYSDGEAANDCKMNILSSLSPEVKRWEDAPYYLSDLKKDFNVLGLKHLNRTKENFYLTLELEKLVKIPLHIHYILHLFETFQQ